MVHNSGMDETAALVTCDPPKYYGQNCRALKYGKPDTQACQSGDGCDFRAKTPNTTTSRRPAAIPMPTSHDHRARALVVGCLSRRPPPAPPPAARRLAAWPPPAARHMSGRPPNVLNQHTKIPVTLVAYSYIITVLKARMKNFHFWLFFAPNPCARLGIGTGSPYPRGYTGFTRAGTGMGSVGYTRVTRGFLNPLKLLLHTRTLPAGKPVPVPAGTGTQPPRVRVRVVAGMPTGLPVPMPMHGFTKLYKLRELTGITRRGSQSGGGICNEHRHKYYQYILVVYS
ncbi:hypothetical protein GGX14DRAFT_397160 [Mycena pura]|uniref:Uncharacterized protein n=1 Tax=Mycena pura TaxID=153505 RepID=A0AAD6YAV3_9AGAR|nr:hypothetical protein GGX14DRAFT_397160 [Mycena pura]